MKKAHLISIGLNGVDPGHYDGWDGALEVCEADAKAIAALAKRKGFTQTELLLTQNATRKNVLDALKRAEKALGPGDTLMVYYSGHGGNEIPDTNRDEDDPWKDAYDESWCLYDGELIDDELYLNWIQFKAGVNLIVLSDSCYSGDVVKLFHRKGGPKRISKAMPKEVGFRTYKKNKKHYDAILDDIKKKSGPVGKVKFRDRVKASLLFISASQEYQQSNANTDEYPKNSLFTAVLLEGMKKKSLSDGSWEKLVNWLKKSMPDYQMPNCQLLGKDKEKLYMKKAFSV